MTRALTRRTDLPSAPATSAPFERSQGSYQMKKLRALPDSPQMKSLKEFQEQKQLPDPFKNYYAASGSSIDELNLMQPPMNLAALMRMPRENNILRQCIEAMVTNVVSHGYRLEYIGPDGKDNSPEALKEKEALESFIDHPNDEMSLIAVMERVKTDKETIGFGTYEIGRDGTGKVVTISHAPAHTFRRTQKGSEMVPCDVWLPREGKLVKTRIKKRFCRWVQMIGERKVYFKEAGDPRKIDPKTGKENKDLTFADSATEIMVDDIYSAGEAYGLPRFIGQLVSIIGSREAELTNLDFFRENATPAVALLVAGGLIPQTTLDQLEQLFTGVRGRKSMNRWVVVEAEGDHRAANIEGVMPVPKMELKPLNNDRQKDGLFKEYGETCQENIRSAWRIAGLFTGHAKDYTFASAKSAFEIADSQVFGPERRKTNDTVNYQFLMGYEPKFWSFRLQPAKITDPEEVIRALKYFDGIGAMTPNTAIAMVNEYFDTQVPQITDAWGSYPFELVKVMAQQGRLKGVEDLAEKLDPLVGASGSGGPGGTPPADDKAKGKGKTPPANDTKTKEDEDAAWQMVEALKAIRTLARAA